MQQQQQVQRHAASEGVREKAGGVASCPVESCDQNCAAATAAAVCCEQDKKT
jgi:hypothetical protein